MDQLMPGILIVLPVKLSIDELAPRIPKTVSDTDTGKVFAIGIRFPLQGTITLGSSYWMASTVLLATSSTPSI
jgi:hypothetical protein